MSLFSHLRSNRNKFLLVRMPDKLSCFDSLWENFSYLFLKCQTSECRVDDANLKPSLYLILVDWVMLVKLKE